VSDRFFNPTRIVYGPGSLSQLPDHLPAGTRAEQILLISDAGLRRAKITQRAQELLPGAEIFEEIEPNPRLTTVDRAGDLARDIGARVVVGLGGGSVLDAAKAVALLAVNPGSIADYEGRERYSAPPLPVLAVPTTCGTGSEVTWVAVITHTGRRFKMSIKGPAMFPAVALVDPDLLASLPPALVASTGMDALVHAIEAYTVKPATFVTDAFAVEAVRMSFRFLRKAWAGIRDDHEARDGVMKASLLAGLGFGNSDVGAVHCLSESVGALLDTPHGVANAVFLPYVMEFNLPAASGRYADLARAAGLEGGDTESLARRFIQEIRELAGAIGIPEFKRLGIPEERFREIADKSFANNSNPSNARDASAEDYLGILERAQSEGV
jgi:alcohol dehydrogenase